MMKNWKDVFEMVKIEDFNENVFNMIGHEWFLLTAGAEGSFNTMTASWGTMGILWNKPIVQVFVRPVRYTFEFINEQDYFTLSFLGKENRKILNFCGSQSGREVDKIKEIGLIPVKTKDENMTFEQSRIVFECKKIYFDDLKPVFILPEEVDTDFYPNKDYHRIFIGEIKAIYKKK